jgi:cytochrome c oxidase subunit II
VLFALGSAVFVGVVAVSVVGLTRRSGDGPGNRLVIAGGVAIPAVVLSSVLGVTIWAGTGVRELEDDLLVVEVTGHRYWWDVRYPESGARTANEIHVPVDRPVELVLRSDDVIHSFWVPRVAGKLDLVPGRENRMKMEVTEVGRFDGVCAEFCGLQHANMRIQLVSHAPDEFDEWLERNGADRSRPTDPTLARGWEAFFSNGCSYCHTINGTPASGEFGPDLSDLASRERIASGLLPNDRASLAGWILDPQQTKPGNSMPPTLVEPSELDALLDYLESLE